MYEPNDKNREILSVAMSHIQSVPYDVSLRWVFYRLLQAGFYSKKQHYSSWKSLASIARKRFFEMWRPDTLTDETREIVILNGGYSGEAEAREKYFEDLVEDNPVFLDHFAEQQETVIICFEARTMTDQFRHYTNRIDLVPFGGDPSIPLKWQLAKKIEGYDLLYGKPVRILYFGDYDDKGLQIANSAMVDVEDWCDIPFDLTKCGLTLEQAIEFNIPENPDKPGEYQWEALSDSAARTIITEAVDEYVDMDVLYEISSIEKRLTAEFRERMNYGNDKGSSD